MNKNIMRAVGFGEQVDRVEEGKCPICAEKIDMKNFKDELLRKEFKISGMCQKCQDSVFGY